MDLDVVGRHALFFDDDSAAAFVNSGEALVDWNSLLIDRYDVRHLLSAPPPPRKRRPASNPEGSSAEAEIDNERYLDLKEAIEEEESDGGANLIELGGYHSVAFSYGNTVDSNDQKIYNDGMGDSEFRPPFPIPESLLHCLPPTEKVHQIIARTALFVSKNGGQSEIVLRVKQGNNPTFGFLMPDHQLHPYFRYLIDHPDLLKSNMVGNFENKDYSEKASGALSLLGSVYGSGDDEDVAVENIRETKENESRKTVETGILSKTNEKDEAQPKHLISEKEKIQVLKKNSLLKISKAGIPKIKKKEPHTTLPSASVKKPSSSDSLNALTVEPVIIEPPSDIKKMVDRVVEFILKNGPQFEAVLTEQDSKIGRFPFLVRSNLFNPYYANVLRKAQESKLSGKSFLSKKDDQMVSRLEKKSSLGKQIDSTKDEIPYDYDRKEKFKMVLGKSKKDVDERSSTAAPSPHCYALDAAQTAAILQAATRGVKSSHFVPNISLNGEITKESEAEAHMTKEQKLKAERLKRAKMFISMLKTGAGPSKSETPRALSMEPQENVVSDKEKEENSFILKGEYLATKDESEKKLSDGEIHERLSRRKYRSKSSRYEVDEERDENDDGEKENNEKHIRKKHQSHRSSRYISKEVEEDEDHRHGKRKHRSHRSSRENKIEKEVDDDEEEDRYHKHDKRIYRSRNSSHEIEEEKEEDNDHRHETRKHRSHRSSHENEKEEDEEDRDQKHSKRKHRSHRSSHKNEKEEDDDGTNHKKSHKKHRSYHSSDEDDEENDYYEEKHDKHSKKKHRSRHSSRRSKDKYKNRDFSRDKSPDEEDHPNSSSEKRRNISRSVEDLEEGEISSKSSEKSRDDSVDALSLYGDGRAPSQPSEATEVPDDLRAKIRAMLMENF